MPSTSHRPAADPQHGPARACPASWEALGPDELLVVLVSADSDEALARCRPDQKTCALVDLPD